MLLLLLTIVVSFTQQELLNNKIPLKHGGIIIFILDMKIKMGVVEKHQYEGVREFEEIDLDKFPIIKQFMDVNPNCTEQELLSYIKKIKDEEFKKFITELSWNSIIKENFSKNKTEFKIEIEK